MYACVYDRRTGYYRKHTHTIPIPIVERIVVCFVIGMTLFDENE